jgi:hypothetical protein
MSATPFSLYASAAQAILEGELALNSAKFQAVLLTGQYVPESSHSTYADISGNEVSGAAGTGYVTGGAAVPVTVQPSGAGAAFEAVSGSTVWENCTFSAQYVVLVEMAGATLAPTDKLLAYSELNSAPVAVASAPFTVNWPAGGILSIP